MSIIGHKGIQVLSDINSVDDLPEIADVESEAVWYIESGDLAPDYIAPSFWDGEQFNEWISLFDGEVFAGIPDSELDYYWKISEGDGSKITDSIEAVEASFTNSPTWVEVSDRVGGWQLDIDGGNDGYETGQISEITSNKYSIVGWVELNQTDQRRIIYGLGDGNLQGNLNTDGDGCVIHLDDGNLVANIQDGGLAGAQGARVAVDNRDGDLLFYGAAINADTSDIDLYVWSGDEQIGSDVGQDAGDKTINEYSPNLFSDWDGGSESLPPDRKDVAIGFTDELLSESEIQSVWEQTK